MEGYPTQCQTFRCKVDTVKHASMRELVTKVGGILAEYKIMKAMCHGKAHDPVHLRGDLVHIRTWMRAEKIPPADLHQCVATAYEKAFVI